MNGTFHQAKVLGSWKEIAAYLGKGIRTVQRWERDLGLPVRRPDGAAKGVVCASPEDLDCWLAVHWSQRGPVAPVSPFEPIPHEAWRTDRAARREVRLAHQELVHGLHKATERLRVECEALIVSTGRSKQARNGRGRRP